MSSTKRVRTWRLLNPIKDCYQRSKAHAKSRGIHWDIDELQWWVFCLATMYHKRKGIGAKDLSIDRVDVTKGYSFTNIQVLTMEENTRKKMKVDAAQKMKGTGKQPDDPF